MKNTGTVKIKTERLVLRKFRLNDYFVFSKWFCTPYASRYSVGESQKTKKQALRFILNKLRSYYIKEKNDFYFWALTVSGKAVGFVGLLNWEEKGNYSFFYAISPDYCSRGYVTEGVKAVIDYMKTQNAKILYVAYDGNNIPSKKVVDKCGFVYNKTIQNYFKYPDGRTGDRVVCYYKIK